jgi:hypothetical protein
MHVAAAAAFDAPYRVIAEDIYPGGKLEDPDVCLREGTYYLTVEDNEGQLTGFARHGAQLVSANGRDWSPRIPARAYTHELCYDDGTYVVAERRERPELFDARSDAKGLSEPTHLVSGVWSRGEAWCIVQGLRGGTHV